MDPLGELTALPRSIAGFEGVGPRKREGLGGSVEGVCGGALRVHYTREMCAIRSPARYRTLST